MRVNNRGASLVAAAGLGLAGLRLLKQQSMADLHGEVALITGSPRGLGFLIARELAAEGCKLVLCARDAQELAGARDQLVSSGAEVLAVPCDVSDRAQVQHLVQEAMRRFGRVDILVNNAGIIQVGPLETMTLRDFEEALGAMYWGTVYPALAILPFMRASNHGRIVNVTSIGGVVSVPHLLPYSGAKFAATGFSEGLRAELAGTGIRVTTIVPGLMRTGSYLNAWFKGQTTGEFAWFSLGDTLPFISMDAERAARQIVHATRRGDAYRVLSLPATFAARFHGLFPGTTTQLLGLVNRFMLPKPGGLGTMRVRGWEPQGEIEQSAGPIWNTVTGMGLSAAARFRQRAAPGAPAGEGPRKPAA